MPLRKFTEVEKERLKLLTSENVDFTLIQPTWTGLDKGYMDAIAPVRNFLREKRLHNYDVQGQGARENGVKLSAYLVSESEIVEAKASLYRPKTKKGDPRIWFSKLHYHVRPDDLLALVEHENTIAVINITEVDIAHVLNQKRSGPLWQIVHDVSAESNSIANELLSKLRQIAAMGPTPSIMDKQADTAIGRTLEAALGIAMNSNRAPDYKGIEIKSFRRAKTKSRSNRKQLFTKVPNWKISKFDSMEDILDAFGYCRDGHEK